MADLGDGVSILDWWPKSAREGMDMRSRHWAIVGTSTIGLLLVTPTAPASANGAGICRLDHSDDGVGYIVADRDDMIDFRNDAVDCSNYTIHQTADISLDDWPTAIDGWRGTFEGHGYAITDSDSDPEAPLFTDPSGSIVLNDVHREGDVVGSDHAGGLIESSSHAVTISNSSYNGDVQASDGANGTSGTNGAGVLSGPGNDGGDGTAGGSGGDAGGLIGAATGAVTISDSYALGNVTGGVGANGGSGGLGGTTGSGPAGSGGNGGNGGHGGRAGGLVGSVTTANLNISSSFASAVVTGGNGGNGGGGGIGGTSNNGPGGLGGSGGSGGQGGSSGGLVGSILGALTIDSSYSALTIESGRGGEGGNGGTGGDSFLGPGGLGGIGGNGGVGGASAGLVGWASGTKSISRSYSISSLTSGRGGGGHPGGWGGNSALGSGGGGADGGFGGVGGMTGGLVGTSIGALTVDQSFFFGVATSGDGGNGGRGGQGGNADPASTNGSGGDGGFGGVGGRAGGLVATTSISASVTDSYADGSLQSGDGGQGGAGSITGTGGTGGSTGDGRDGGDSGDVGGFFAELTGPAGTFTNSYSMIDVAVGTGGLGGSGGVNGARGTDGDTDGIVASGTVVPTSLFCLDEADGCSTGSFSTHHSASAAQLSSQSFLESNGWDFDSVWCIKSSLNDGFPVLQTIEFGPGDTNRCRSARPSRPTLSVSLDPAGGTCGAEGSRHDSVWQVDFRGSLSLPHDCVREGYAFLGWIAQGSTSPIATISRSMSLTASWGQLPPKPFGIFALVNFLCDRCTTALLIWPAPPTTADFPVLSIDSVDTACAIGGRILVWDWCLVADLGAGSNHVASVAWRNQYGLGTPSTTTFTLW